MSDRGNEVQQKMTLTAFWQSCAFFFSIQFPSLPQHFKNQVVKWT